MIRKCRGTGCKKPATTVQPRKDSRVVFYLCNDCATKGADNAKIAIKTTRFSLSSISVKSVVRS